MNLHSKILIYAVLSRGNFCREFTHFFGVPFTGLKIMVAYQKWQISGMSAILRETDNWYEVILLSWGVYLYIVYFCWSFIWQHFKMAKERDMHHYYWPLVSTCSINLYKRIWPSSLTSSSETTISMQLMSFISRKWHWRVTLHIMLECTQWVLPASLGRRTC